MDALNGQKIDLELLAPAGGMEQLQAAVNFGADAVYLGLDQYSMRAKAKNFSFDELVEGCDYAHERGAKVHVTLNIQMHEAELKTLPQYFEACQSAGVDALIVGDIGAMSLARKFAPSCDLHVSTQAAVANHESALMFYNMGAKRVVLAREMTMDEIFEFTSHIPDDLEVEAFAHGAQCMAQSGRCLISSYLCDRSANVGSCTQPCRWGYHVIEEKRPGMEFDVEEAGGLTYLFNAQDLCMVDHLQELKDAGVDSIKIEGRNKKAFYVASVVAAYRRVLDGEPAENVHEELQAISHRPYSTGFYYGQPRQSIDFDGYTQETLHVGDVVSVEGNNVQVRCRNKILDGEELEVLAPYSEILKCKLSNFVWDNKPQEEINRPGEIYTATSNIKLPENSYLRKRESRTTSRAVL